MEVWTGVPRAVMNAKCLAQGMGLCIAQGSTGSSCCVIGICDDFHLESE